MHAAGMWTAFSGLLSGQTVVLHDTKPRFDPRTVLETAQREKIGLMTMVGDAYAAPIVEELGRRTYDLSSMFAIGTGGAGHQPETPTRTAGTPPADHHHQRIRLFGDRQHGSPATPSAKPPPPKPSSCGAGGLVLADDYPASSIPATPRWAGRHATAAYRSATSTTKRRRRRPSPRWPASAWWSPGDRASLDADGTLRLLGRDSLVVNTGGEKVFVEEIEEVLRHILGWWTRWPSGAPVSGGGEEIVALRVDPRCR